LLAEAFSKEEHQAAFTCVSGGSLSGRCTDAASSHALAEFCYPPGFPPWAHLPEQDQKEEEVVDTIHPGLILLL
jgi:hypothetical protein